MNWNIYPLCSLPCVLPSVMALPPKHSSVCGCQEKHYVELFATKSIYVFVYILYVEHLRSSPFVGLAFTLVFSRLFLMYGYESSERVSRLRGACPFLTCSVSGFSAYRCGLARFCLEWIRWASFLGYPLVPPEVQTVPSHTPEGMRGLQEGHRLLLMGAGVEPPKSSSAAARGLSLLRSLRLRKRSREPDEGEEPPKKRRAVDKTLPEHDADRQ
ncbi:lipase [Toxoplasma gondii VAND]|uniref:Lipase n=1 Tax=Toxoplasma gondii VAND TaxID=933077 RepID=A0A086QCW7_TOXGO|nr:lipase [Toxoplasma gondii VAND]